MLVGGTSTPFQRLDDSHIWLVVPPHDAGTINVQIESGLSEDKRTGLVRMRVQTIPENRPFYELDISMIALVMVDQVAPNMPLDRYFTTSGAALLYPFVRQVVADLTSRGRFGPVWLNPMNVTAVPLSVMTPLPKLQPGPARRASDGGRKKKARKRSAGHA